MLVQDLNEAKMWAHKQNIVEEKRMKAILNQQKKFEIYAKSAESLADHLNIKSLLAVHITKFFPQKGKINTKGSGTDSNQIMKSLSSIEYLDKEKLFNPRETIHFTLNHPVVEHMMGANWSEMPYAVLIPLEDIIKRVVVLNPIDTFIVGDLKLPSSAEILMSEVQYFGTDINEQKSRVKSWDKQAGTAKIVPVQKGVSLYDAIAKRIIEKGYSFALANKFCVKSMISFEDGLKLFVNSEFFSKEEKEDFLKKARMNQGHDWLYIFNELSKKLKIRHRSHSGSFWQKIERVLSSSLFFFNDEDRYTKEKLYKIHRFLRGNLRESKYYKKLLERLMRYKDKNIMNFKWEDQEVRNSTIRVLTTINELIDKLTMFDKIANEIQNTTPNIYYSMSWKDFHNRLKVRARFSKVS